MFSGKGSTISNSESEKKKKKRKENENAVIDSLFDTSNTGRHSLTSSNEINYNT